MFIYFDISLKISTMSFIKDLFTEICKRGCIIETKSGYLIDHLPKCLVTINDNIKFVSKRDPQAEFKISSIIPGSVHVYFYFTQIKIVFLEKNYYTTVIEPLLRRNVKMMDSVCMI